MRPPLVMLLPLFLLAAACDDEPDDAGGSETFTVTMPAASMEPTIKAGSEVTVTKVDDDYEPRRGEIVLFRDPGGWLFPGDNEGSLLKRVIGVPGDTVVCCDESGRLVIDGEPLDEPYLAESRPCAAAVPGSGCVWTAGPVPDGGIFVLGDNRDASADSRFHMCRPGEDSCEERPWVPIDLVRGTVEGQ